MKFSKIIITGLLAVGLGLSSSGISFANFAHKENREALTKLLNNSAAALQATRPDLAAELSKWSNQESEEAQEANEKKEKAEKKELEEKAENEKHANREAHLKLLRDSAAVLQQSNPLLSADLTKTAERKAKWMAEKKEEK